MSTPQSKPAWEALLAHAATLPTSPIHCALEQGEAIDPATHAIALRQEPTLAALWRFADGVASDDDTIALLRAMRDNPVPPTATGTAWNALTFWVAGGCVLYGHPEIAGPLLETALNRTAHWFRETGILWEFYAADGSDPRATRWHDCPPQPNDSEHNPIAAMVRLWEACHE